jgi:hypothetical protein
MKTTVDFAELVLRRVRQLAARWRATLKAVFEAALLVALERAVQAHRPATLRTHSVDGRGLRAGLSWDDWNTLRAFAYDERGA